MRLECRVCGHRFERGHRVRLALSPAYWPHAWPSPEPVTLTIEVDGPSVLALPVRRPGAANGPRALAEEAPSFAAPEASGPPNGARRDERSRQIRVDHETRRHEIVDRERHEQTVPGTGIRYVELATDVYSIVEDDPLSASVRCARETSATGPAVHWRVVLTSTMTCDVDTFHVSEEYVAFEGSTPLCAKTREYAIPREGV